MDLVARSFRKCKSPTCTFCRTANFTLRKFHTVKNWYKFLTAREKLVPIRPVFRTNISHFVVCGRVPWLYQYWPGGFMLFVVLCPGTPEGSTGSGSGFKASQKTGQRLKVSSDRLGEAGNRTCDPWFTRHRFIPYTTAASQYLTLCEKYTRSQNEGVTGTRYFSPFFIISRKTRKT